MARAHNFFHTVENFFPRCGKMLAVALGAALLGGALAGCATVKANRLAVPAEKRWVVTASGATEGHEADLAVDGRADTWWHCPGGKEAWLQVDMARAAMVCGFSLQWGEPYAAAYALQTSLDGVHWMLSYETKTSDGGWDQVCFEPVLARHVRLLLAPELQGAALVALEIKGLADQPQAWVDGQPDPKAAALLDGREETAWVSTNPAAVVELDLRAARPVGSVRVDWGTSGFAQQLTVEVSTNRTEWQRLGQLQPQVGDFDVLMAETALPAQYVRLSFADGTGDDGCFALTGIALRGDEGTARPWARYEVAAAHAPEGIYPDLFRKRQTYWSVAAGPAATDAEALLDEWGVFAPRPRGPTLTPLLLMDGQVLSAQQAERVEHRLGGEGAPLPEVTWHMASGLKLRIQAQARTNAPAAMAWTMYELVNDSLMTQTGRWCWVVRPVRLALLGTHGGLAPIYKIRVMPSESGWQEMWVNDEPLFAVPATNMPFGAAAFAQGDVAESLLRGELPRARTASDAEGLASGLWWRTFSLAPGGRMRWVVAGNALPPGVARPRRFPWPKVNGSPSKVADLFSREWVDATWSWRDATGHYQPRIARPDAIECLHAQVGWLLGVRGVDGESTETIALRVAALLRAGQAKAALPWIEMVAAAQQDDGWVPVWFMADGTPAPRLRMGQYAGQGQLAFMALEYYRFTQDAAFLQAMFPRLQNALAYLQRLRADQEKTDWLLPEDQRFLVDGLLPASGPRPGSAKPQHRYADQIWALLGWKEIRTAAALLGAEAEATWADEQYRLLKAQVRRSLRARMDLMTGMWVPGAAEDEQLDIQTVALLFWPGAETDLVEPHELQTSLDMFYADFLQRRQPGWSGVMANDEGALLGPLATMGRTDYAREVLYSLLDRRQPRGWQSWPDISTSDPRQMGHVTAQPDIRAAALYFLGVRGLAARETDKQLDLFAGAPAEWLQHGEGFRVFGMPTAFGPLDLAGRWEQKEFTVEIGGGAQPPAGYRLWWPRNMRPIRVLADGRDVTDFDGTGVNLPPKFKGWVEVLFPQPAPWPRDP